MRRGWPGGGLSAGVRHALRRARDRVLGFDPLWSGLFVVVVAFLLGTGRAGPDSSASPYRVGRPAPADIVAPGEIVEPDEAATERRRLEARRAVPDVYVHDAERSARLARELEAKVAQREVSGPDREQLARRVAEAFEAALGGPVVANKAVVERQPEILLVHLPSAEEQRLSRYDAIVDLPVARSRVRRAVLSMAGLEPEEAARLADLAVSFVDANTAYDPRETASRRDAAAAAVRPVLVRRPTGSLLLRRGETVTEEVLAKVGVAAEPRRGPGRIARLGGLLFVVGMLAVFLHRYSRYHQPQFRKVRHLHALLTLVLVASLVVAHGMLWIAREVADDLAPPYDRPELYAFLVPLGGGAILVGLLADSRIAMVYSTFAALLFGGLTGWDVWRTLWALLVQWASVYAISAYRDRAALLRAGLLAGGAGAVSALAIQALASETRTPGETLLVAGLAFLGGGLGTGLLVSFALPLFERLFNVLTDVRLLELSNANHPLLAELAVRAPGSYNHSLVVGALAEEAARAVGANALFCRVAAFYHDVGKLRKPEYYVENQRDSNPHDRLAPSMSALVISSHVKDGVRMAREAGLPEQIVEIIPQHHGTRLMTYFFEKARRRAERSRERVREEEFRYPGPKPQSREAAIFMLADGVEAAARSLSDPTPSRLREVIHRVTNSVILDGQLDECDLTFSDLAKIEQAFLRTLVSMHHHRIAYPGFEFGRPIAESGPDAARRAGVLSSRWTSR